MSSSTAEVVVVGAGPTGLCAALALGRLGVRTIVLERRETTSTHPRGHVENGRTMELFRLWGIEEEVREQGLPREFLGRVSFMTRMAGIDLGDIRFAGDSEWLMGHDGKGPAALSSTPQDRLEPILLRAIQAQPGVEVRFATEVTGVESRSDGVTVSVHGANGGTETIDAAYAVVADGPRSPIREALGIDVEGPGNLGAQLGIYFHADLSRWIADRPSALYWLYNPDVQGVVIALDGHERWHLLFAYDPDVESIEDYPPERCAAIVRDLVGSDDAEIDVRSVLPWRMRAAVAQRFASGRVFLAGDAAHTMPPTGGMGMNSGIGDVHNLAWKLHAVLRGQAGADLLETYEPERMPVGKRNTDNSVSNARTMMETGLAGIMQRDPEGFAAIEVPAGQAVRDRLAAAIPGQLAHFSFDGLSFGYCYDSTAVVSDGTQLALSQVGVYRPSATPGARAPHVWLERDGEELSTIDLFERRFVLLAAGAPWADAARRVAADLGVELDAYTVARDGEADLLDPTGAWPAAYGVGPQGAALVRPDGHVAWRSPIGSEQTEDELRSVLLLTVGVI
jgi:putative polyketide hydroxylase